MNHLSAIATQAPSTMGPRLRAEVERQLLIDLAYHGVSVRNCYFDWSEVSPEGHATRHLDGELQNWSGVQVRRETGELVAAGWIDFVHGGGDLPLFVFWDLLHIEGEAGLGRGKEDPGIPIHVWKKLPDLTKSALIQGSDDTFWRSDPLVASWARTRK